MTQTIIKVPAAGAFDPTDIEITDDTSGALLIKEGSNEYMRIDTTNGSEKTIFKTQSGANTGFFVNAPAVGDVLSIVRGGSPATKALLNVGTLSFQVDSGQILNDLVSDSNTFKVDGTNVAPLTITGDSNATFTLDTANNGVFKVEDNLGSPTQFLAIDSNTASESIKLALTPANADRFFEMTSAKIHARCQNSQLNMSTQGITFTAYDDYAFGQFGAGKKLLFKDNQTAEERFSVDKESNATFTLDHGSGATFKVVDDNSSPRTFISITEGSNTRCLIPTLSFNEVKNASAGRLMQLTTSNGIAIESTPLNHIGSGSLTYDQSNDGTSIDIGKTPSFTVVYSSSASGAATSGITLQVTATDFQDGCVAPQYLVLHNQNATHSAKFILDPIGDFAAKETATTGTDAADLIGSGFTLAAGKMAVFTLLACRVRDTGSHYFYCVSLHTKT